ncbi:MAG: PKD domain-containing protein [Bacteroidales bacterium]|nr:PKD domain-containing protein [Bacteroidales bacterium]
MRKILLTVVFLALSTFFTFGQCVSCKIFLQGAYQNGSIMNTSINGLVPAVQPFNVDPWSYPGTENLNSIPLNMVDWVLVELRDPADPRIIMAQRVAVLLSDGNVVDTNLNSAIDFSGILPGDYFLCIHHRNHFPVMSAIPVAIPNAISYNFRDTLNFPPYGGGSQALIELEPGIFGMIAGDVNKDGILKYSGPANDRGPVLQYIVNESGSTSITTTVSGYSGEDITMDSIIKYSGSGNDPSVIIQNLVGLTGSTSITSVYNSIVPLGIIKKECGSDTIILKVNNYQYGTVQWEESYDTVNWVAINSANDTIYKFLPTESKYYRAVLKFSTAPPEYTEHTIVQIPPDADAGSDRVMPGNYAVMMGNMEPEATGTWSIILGNGGSFTDINDPYAEFQGSDTLYTLVWTLSNTCGVSSDTISIELVQNVYLDVYAIVDSTDQIFSDSAQMANGIYIIRFSNPVPAITDSTVLMGLVDDGFLRAVDSLVFQGDTVTMFTSQGTLEDITIEGAYDLAQIFDIDTNLQRSNGYERMTRFPTRKELSNPKYKTGNYYYVVEETPVYTYPGVDASIGRNRDGGALIDLNFDCNLNNSSNVNLDLTGYYRFNPNLKAELKMRWFSVKLFKMGMYNGTIERNYKIDLIASASSNLLDHEFTLLSLKKNIIFVLGGVPVWVQTQLNIDGSISADVSASMNLSHEYTKINTYTAAVEYENGQWSYPFSKSQSINTQNNFTIQGDLSQNFNVGPNITFKLYGIVGPYIDARLTEDFNLCVYNANWQANLDIGGKLTVGAKAEALGVTLFDISKTWEQGFYKLQFPNKLEMISGNNQMYNTGSPLAMPVKVKVLSNKGFTVPLALVKFQPKNGGSVQNTIVISNSSGEVQTVWTPGGNQLSELEVFALDCDGNQIGNTPLVFHANSGGTNCTQSSLSASIFTTGITLSPQGHMGNPPYTYSTDGINYSLQVPQIIPVSGQTYNFYVKDNPSCVATVSYNAPVDPCANSNLNVNTFVMGNVIEATAINGNPPYLFSLDNATSGFTSNSTFQNVSVGSHTVYVQDNNGCMDSETVNVSSNSVPIIAEFVANPTYTNIGNIVEFLDLSNSATSWSWDFGDGNTSTQQNLAHSYSSLGSYTVTLTVTNSYGSDTETKNNYIHIGTSSCPASFTDARDNHNYTAVQIGSQCWMAENLAYLPLVSPSSQGSNTTPYYYVYGYQGTSVSAAKATSNYQTYSVLYNWPAAMAGEVSSNSVPSGVQGICPSGWHLPSDEEWKILEGEVDSQYGYPDPEWDGSGYRGLDAGGNLKETGTTHWSSPNTGATNSSGFTALPAGNRSYNGSFNNLGDLAFFWSSAENAWLRDLHYDGADVYRRNGYEDYGFSCRCLKD